jgi:hypothetical protein
MDLVFLLAIPVVLWTQSWYLLGLYPNPRSLGMVSGVVAIVLLAAVLYQDRLPLAVEPPADLGKFIELSTALSAFVVGWAVYAALVSGVYLWGTPSRTLGFFSLFLAVVSAVYGVYFFIGDRLLDSGDIISFSWLLGVDAILLAILAGFQFFYLALIPASRGEPAQSCMKTVTGWFYLVFSIAIGVLSLLLLLGLNPEL